MRLRVRRELGVVLYLSLCLFEYHVTGDCAIVGFFIPTGYLEHWFDRV